MKRSLIFWSVWLIACFFVGVAGRAYYEAAAAGDTGRGGCGCADPGCRCPSRVIHLGGGLVDLSEVWMVQPGRPAPAPDAPGVVLVYRRGPGGSHPVEGVTDTQWRTLLDAFPATDAGHQEPGKVDGPVQTDGAGKPSVTGEPTLSIMAPKSGVAVRGSDVEVKAMLGGAVDRVMHWHLQLDGGPTSTLDPKVTSYTFASIPPGDHVLVAWLSDLEHKDVIGSRVEVKFSSTIPPPVDLPPLPPLPAASVEKVEVSTDLAEIGVGSSTTARVVARSAEGTVLSDRTVVWSSSDPGIVTVNIGTVRGVALGTASIIAEVGGKSGSAAIKVVAAGHEHEHGAPPAASGGGPKVAQSGPWSDPKTWVEGRLPVRDEVVAIPAGMVVLYDLANGPRLPTITVEAGGTLRYPTDKSTRTLFGTLWVALGGRLEVGTAKDPVRPDILHEFIRANLPLDSVRYPDELDGGVIGYGEIEVYGDPKTSGPCRLTREPKAGDTTLVLERAVSGWRPGDQLVLPGSQVWGYDSDERPILKSLSADGKTVTLAGPVKRDHPGARDGDGKLNFLPHIGNLTRNVLFRSEDPDGVRGHTLYTGRCHPVVRYAEFRDLGRTRLDIIDLTPRPIPADAPQPFIDTTFPVTVTDGQLRIRITDRGGPDTNFTICAIKVRPAAQGGGVSKTFDFGPPGSPVAEGAIGVAVEPYTKTRGYGWADPTGLNPLDRGTPADPATRDFVYGSDGTFLVDLPNGGYTATVTFGDLGWTHEQIEVTAQGKVAASNVTTGPAPRPLNMIGRYPFHFHHDEGPADPPEGGQFIIEGCAIWSSTPEGENRKWGIAVHASHFGRVANNVIYNVSGAGFTTEDGDESGNVIEGNFIVRIAGTQNDPRNHAWGRSHAGTGLYLAGLANIVRGNVVADTINDAFAFGIFGDGVVRIPTAPGQDPARYVAVNMHAFTVREFSDNEGYASKGGMTVWHVGVSDPSQRSVIKDLRLWHMGQGGVGFYPSDRVRLDGLVVLGGPGGVVYAVNTGHYTVPGLEIVRSRIEGCVRGVALPTVYMRLDVPLIIEDSYFRNYVNIAVPNQEYDGDDWRGRGRRTIIRNVRYGPDSAIDIEMESAIPAMPLVLTANILIPDEVLVYDHNGKKGDDFRVYYEEQAPDYVVPATGADRLLMVGAPEPGLTNAQAWAKHGIAIAGAVAPKDAVRRPEIKGLVGPLESSVR